MSASRYGLTASNPLVSRNPLVCSWVRMFGCLLEPVIEGLWTRLDRENRRDASLLAKDFMVDVVREQIFAWKET